MVLKSIVCSVKRFVLIKVSVSSHRRGQEGDQDVAAQRGNRYSLTADHWILEVFFS